MKPKEMATAAITSVLDAAASNEARRGISAYALGSTETCQYMSYEQLQSTAHSNSRLLRRAEGFEEEAIFLLHFDNHLDNMVWFWSVCYAGGVPAMSTPFVGSLESRKAHIQHLHKVLQDPICLTRERLVQRDFSDTDVLKMLAVESLCLPNPVNGEKPTNHLWRGGGDLACMMLTSGSSGNAKAVCLTHANIFAALAAKTAALSVPPNTSFFNFIGLDHVVGLIELHMHAMFIGCSQVQHRISRTFAPNFFLAKLRRSLDKAGIEWATTIPELDLSCLTHFASGGEANPVETSDALSNLLTKYGAPRGTIIPAWGMTETCAGSIFNLNFPDLDLQQRCEFASVGQCAPGIEMRVSAYDDDGDFAPVTNARGSLEVRGPLVFERYFNNPTATQDSFTSDGWFKTGDEGIIDDAGNLHLIGRAKEVMTINGVKYLPHEIELAIEEAEIPGVKATYLVCFSYRPKGAPTEHSCVIYVRNYEPGDVESRVTTQSAIVKVVTLQTGSKPYVVPVDPRCLEKSTLHKLSRAKIRSSLENGEYKNFEDVNRGSIRSYQASRYAIPATAAEDQLMSIFQDVLELSEGELGVDAPYFETGLTSIELIKLKAYVEKAFELPTELPMITIMTNSTVRSLASAVEAQKAQTGRIEYDPVVTLRQPAPSSKAPLFLIHPGVGEVLVFIGLVKFLTERPVYALRAKGFNKDEPTFRDLDEILSTYHTAIKKAQPGGPYALAGYSFGAMLAFEVSKRLIAEGDEVRFLGNFNLLPHIKWRMRQFDWVECLSHLAYFSELISEQSTSEVTPYLRQLPSREAVLDHLFKVSSPSRVGELALTPESLAGWADVAYSLQSRAIDYEPSGKVPHMDVFYCRPLAIMQITKKEWLEKHLRKWGDFVENPSYHEVDGAHYTMLLPEHVHSFQKKLKRALEARGV